MAEQSNNGAVYAITEQAGYDAADVSFVCYYETEADAQAFVAALQVTLKECKRTKPWGVVPEGAEQHLAERMAAWKVAADAALQPFGQTYRALESDFDVEEVKRGTWVSP